MWSGDEEPASTNSPLPVSSTSPAPVSRRKRHKPHRRSTPQPHSRTSEPPVVVSEKDSLGSLPKSRNANTNVSGSTDSSSEDLRTDFHPDARVEGLKDLCCVTFPNLGANPSETASPDFVNPESVSPLSDNPISDFSGCAKTELRGLKTVSADISISDTDSSDAVYSHSLDVKDSSVCALLGAENIKNYHPGVSSTPATFQAFGWTSSPSRAAL